MMLNVPQISDAVKRYSYLLGQTDLFKHFVDIKVCHINDIACAVLMTSP